MCIFSYCIYDVTVLFGFVGCDCLRCSCWCGSSVVYCWAIVVVHIVGVFVMSVVLLPPVWSVLCVAIWWL
jgi:hypothetical protein